PDIHGALVMKSLAYLGRFQDRDATDVWRLLVHNDHATVINADTAEVLTEHNLDPTRTYQRKNGRTPIPGGSPVHDVLRHPTRCARGELNPHALTGHTDLNRARLPIPPLALVGVQPLLSRADRRT